MERYAWTIEVRERYSVTRSWIWCTYRLCRFEQVRTMLEWCKAHKLQHRVSFDPRGWLY